LHAIFALYRQNNDIKHGGTATDTHHQDILGFYENSEDYNRIFKKNHGQNALRANVQHRHTREFVRFGISKYLKEIAKTHYIKTEDVKTWLNYDEKEIAEKHKQLAGLHQEWVKKRKDFKKQNEYQALLAEINQYRILDNHVKLVDFRKLHKLVMQILSRLAGYAFIYERDLYFMVLAKIHRFHIENLKDNPQISFEESKKRFFIKDSVMNKFNKGQILTALDDKDKKIRIMADTLAKHPDLLEMIDHEKKSSRNDFAHFNMLRKDGFNLTDYLNQTRKMVSYDRKLKNAVAKSMITIFEKEKITLKLKADNNHQLYPDSESLKSHTAKHLGGLKINNSEITESLHSETYLNMVRAIFKTGT